MDERLVGHLENEYSNVTSSYAGKVRCDARDDRRRHEVCYWHETDSPTASRHFANVAIPIARAGMQLDCPRITREA
jgi:hypothetical protein